MKIAELSPHSPSTTSILSDIETLISSLSPNPNPNYSLSLSSISTSLRHSLSSLLPLPFTTSHKLLIWKLSYRLWNTIVDINNNNNSLKYSNSVQFQNISPSKCSKLLDLPASKSVKSEKLVDLAEKSDKYSKLVDLAELRYFAADFLSLASDVTNVPSPYFKIASFYYKTALVYHDLKKFDLAEKCFEKASDLVSKVDISDVTDFEEKKLLLGLQIARAKTAWENSDKNLAINLLNRAKNVLFGFGESYKALASQYLIFGKNILSKNESNSITEGLKLMNEALDLCERGGRVVKKGDEIENFKNLKSKILRFIAASHLQRDEFESVLKCVRVLRENSNGDDHPSLSVLAMKAYLGLGKYLEAEKELKGMAVNQGVPEGVWVSAVESYFQAAGVAGAETTKGVFLGLLGRCHVSAGAAVSVIRRVVGDGAGAEGARVRAKLVAELVADERVSVLFGGEEAKDERTTLHAVLWNCAADHFRAKNFETSAEMFEKSMLYVPYNTENMILRAKGFRVLCLCHLGLSQLDRSQEYINEAEKLQPNIACAFLKFKINLQRNDQDGAITQVQAMTSCIDFNSDFLNLAAHEAVACRAFPVAVASLSKLLDFYSSGKPTSTMEVMVLRHLITILTQDSNKEQEVLKYMKRAQTRLSELGPDCFFGKDEVGRRERDWLAVNSWNIATKAGKEKNYVLCAEFFRLAAEFYGVTIDGEMEGNTVIVCKALILYVSSLLADEKQRKSTLLDIEIKQAIEMLDKAGKILESIPAGKQLDGDDVSTIEHDFFFIYTLNAYDLHARLGEVGPKQLLLIKNFANTKSCKPNHLLLIGLHASWGPRSNHEVAAFALNTCLSAYLASPSPDYQQVALVLRNLITMCTVHKGETDDDVAHGLYKQAYKIMVGLKEGEYPVEEGKWLAMTAWNRAALPARMGQVEMAKKWMNLGFELAGKVPGMGTYRSCMEDFVAGFEKKLESMTMVEASR